MFFILFRGGDDCLRAIRCTLYMIVGVSAMGPWGSQDHPAGLRNQRPGFESRRARNNVHLYSMLNGDRWKDGMRNTVHEFGGITCT